MKKCDILLDVEILEEGYEGLLEDPIVVMGHGDPYTGPSHVTPTKETQVLNTIDFYMNDNITIEAIPSSYINTYDATLTSGDQMLQGITAYSDNIKYTGTIETKAGRDMTVDGFSVIVPSGYYAADVSKTFTVPQGSLQAGQISIDSNGLATYSATASGYFSTLESTSRNIQLATQSGITLVPGALNYVGVESGKYTTGPVIVEAISSYYVGGGVPRREASDLEIADNVITVPSGYYAAAVSHALPSGGNNHTATIVNRDKNIHYSFVEYNGQTYQNLNDTFTFQAGDTLRIETNSWFGGGKIYINDNLVASDNANKVTYNYTLPDYDIKITLFESSNEGTIYITTSYIVISENSIYDVSGYNYAYVEVTSVDPHFIITCSYNTTTDLWEPDRTFEEIDAACKAGKEVVPKTTGTDSFVTGYYMNDFPDEQPGTYIYIVVWHDGDRMIEKYYAINSDGIEDLGGNVHSLESN